MSYTAVTTGNDLPGGVRNGYGTNGAATALRPDEELTVAFLSLGRLLRDQYPARFAEAGKELGFSALATEKVSPWARIEGDLSDPLGQEILAATASARREDDRNALAEEIDLRS